MSLADKLEELKQELLIVDSAINRLNSPEHAPYYRQMFSVGSNLNQAYQNLQVRKIELIVMIDSLSSITVKY